MLKSVLADMDPARRKRVMRRAAVLRKYVRSVGGELELAVTFPDSGRVILSGIGEEPARKPRVRK